MFLYTFFVDAFSNTKNPTIKVSCSFFLRLQTSHCTRSLQALHIHTQYAHRISTIQTFTFQTEPYKTLKMLINRKFFAQADIHILKLLS